MINDSIEIVTDSAGRVVVRNVAALGAGELLSRLIGFAATIYIARTLGIEAYGMVGFGVAIVLYGTTIVDAGLEHTGPREVADAGDQLHSLVSSLLLVRVVWATLVATVAVIAALGLFSGIERTVLALYALALIPIGGYVRWLHIGLQRTALVSVARVLPDFLRVLAIFLLVRGPDHLVIVPIVEISANVLTALILLSGLTALGVKLHMQVDWELAKAVLRRAAPMAVSGMLAVMIYNSDLLFLRIFRDSAEVGLYLAGYTLINFLGPLGHVVAVALVPAFTRLRAHSVARDALFHDSMARVFAAGLPVAVGGSMVAPLLIMLVFGVDYTPSAPVLAILIWAIPIVMLRSVLQAGLIAQQRQDLVLRTTIAAATTNVALNFIAVPLFGMIGAAVTTVIAEAVRLLSAAHLAKRESLPATPPARFLRSAGAAGIMAVVLFALRPDTVWTAIPLGVVVYAMALSLAGGMRIGRAGIEVSV